MVALQRYKVTKEIREVLKHHFEDYFQSLDQVNEVAKRLKDVENSVKSTIETLLRSNSGSSTPTATRRSVVQDERLDPRPFDRVWGLRPAPDDKDVVDFSTWAVFLLHLMVHKAYCVLYRPLFRDPAMFAHDVIRIK